MLTYEQGLALAQEHAPELKVDPVRTSNPNMFVVRKVEGGAPFSILLPDTPADSQMEPEERANNEKQVFITALASAKKHFGIA